MKLCVNLENVLKDTSKTAKKEVGSNSDRLNHIGENAKHLTFLSKLQSKYVLDFKVIYLTVCEKTTAKTNRTILEVAEEIIVTKTSWAKRNNNDRPK